MYDSFQLGWNLSAAGSVMFSNTLLKTRSSAQNVSDLTHLLYRFVILCRYEAIRIAAASRSSSTISRSLVMAPVLVFPGISIQSVAIPISVGMMASIL